MQSERFIALLGEPSTSRAVEHALDLFKIRRRPQVTLDEHDVDGPIAGAQDWLKSRHAGIEFGFEEELSFRGEKATSRHHSYSMLLTQLYFYGQHPEMQPYVGGLPYGLVLSDGRQQVRSKLVRYEQTRRSYVRDTWELPECQLIVSYAEDGAKIGFVLCALRVPPSADTDDVITLPTIDELMHLMGHSLDDPALRKVVKPFCIDNHLHSRGSSLTALMRTEYGIELYFGGVRSMAPSALTNIILYRDREADAHGWKGALPHGLHFDDSPEVVFGKLVRPPDSKSEEDFVGYALWHLPSHSLQVKYSTMHNWILSIRILGPGVWDGY